MPKRKEGEEWRARRQLDLSWRGWGLPWTTGDGRTSGGEGSESFPGNETPQCFPGWQKKKKGAWVGRFCQSGGEQLSLSAPRKHTTFLVLRGESAVWAISARFPGGPVQEESPNVSISPWPKPPLGVAGSQGLSFAQEEALCLPPPCSTASPRVTYCRTSLPRLCNEGFGSCRDLSAVWILLACWNSPASHHFVLTRGGLGCLPPELTSTWLFRPVIFSGGWANLPRIHLLCRCSWESCRAAVEPSHSSEIRAQDFAPSSSTARLAAAVGTTSRAWKSHLARNCWSWDCGRWCGEVRGFLQLWC